MRDFFNRFDFCSHLIVLLCAINLARLAGRMTPRYVGVMWWAGCGVLLAVVGYGYVELRPRQPVPILGLLMVGGIAACATTLLVTVVVAPLALAWEWWEKRQADRRARQLDAELEADERIRELERQRDAEEQRQATARRHEAMERERANRPPPPTRDELAAALRHKYEQTVRMLAAADLEEMELRAAQARAKQQYLQELDRLMR